MHTYQVHFSVHGFLTTFKEQITAEAIDHLSFKDVLNERLRVLGFQQKVKQIFLVLSA